ncbi:MAG: acyltransferase family protein, partial [Alphaproteobacteria bacterium]
MDKKRYHDLDALRGFAMLLGIVIHGLLSFMPIPIPGVPQDINQNPEVYGYVFNFIHGFRMQLFFLISGFFTAMLWRKQGLRKLFKHRAKRILVPLIIAMPILWIFGIAIIGMDA